jgi:hypothetical protein
MSDIWSPWDSDRGIEVRGNVQQNDPAPYKIVHFKVPAAADGARDAYPLCGYGSWHVRWTRNRESVDCPNCLRKLAETNAQDKTSN